MPNEGILESLTRLHSSDTAGEHENKRKMVIVDQQYHSLID